MTAARRHEAGVGLLGVMLFATVIVAVILGYSRHAVLAADRAEATLQAESVRSALSSGLVYAQQTLLAGADTTKALATPDGGKVSIQVAATSVDGRLMTIQSSGGQFSQIITAATDVYLTGGETLPVLTAAARQRVYTSPALIDVNRDTSYQDTELNGLLLVRGGVTLTLKDVVVNGTILSEAGLTGLPSATFSPSQVVVKGGLRIEPTAALPGCAMVAPGCTLKGSDRVEIGGTLVADRVQLTGSGSGVVRGYILTTVPLPISPAIDQPGAGRAPRPWPTVLEGGAQATRRLAFPRHTPNTAEQRAIDQFRFP